MNYIHWLGLARYGHKEHSVTHDDHDHKLYMMKNINCQCTTSCVTLKCSCKKYELACSSAGGS